MSKFLKVKELSEKYNISKETINRYCRKELIEIKEENNIRLCNETEGKINLEKQIERDITKEKLCSELNIKLIRICYTNFNNIEEIINNILIERKFNDYPFGEYSKVRGNGGYPNIIYIG